MRRYFFSKPMKPEAPRWRLGGGATRTRTGESESLVIRQ